MLLTPHDAHAGIVSSFHDSFCLQFDAGTFCVDDHLISTLTTTPSGNISASGNAWSRVNQFDLAGNLVFSNSVSDHVHDLDKDSFTHEFESFFSGSATVGNQTCDFRFMFHIVDDQIQFERFQSCP